MGALFGVCGAKNAGGLAYLGTYAGLHRGHEGAGFCINRGENFVCAKRPGVASKVFDLDELSRISGNTAIAHTRSATSGACDFLNLQPLLGDTRWGQLALAHIGHITNALELRGELERQGVIFQSEIDSEVILHLIAHSSRQSLKEAVVEALGQLEGAYSLVIMAKGQLIAARDPRGFRPLVYGWLAQDSGEVAWLLASETCSLDIVGATYAGEVGPGQIMDIEDQSRPTIWSFATEQSAGQCALEHVYVSRPDSVTFGQSVQDIRHELGRLLAREHPAQADIVVAVPDSGVQAAIGYVEEAGLPFRVDITRNHYVGRLMIDPTQAVRDLGTRVKFNVAKEAVRGERVVLVDDSIMRCITAPKLVWMLREAGASEVHLRISCPPIIAPCCFGVNMPPRADLAAANNSLQELLKLTGADSLGYLSLEGLRAAVRDRETRYCYSCWTGQYPTPVPLMQIGT